MTINLNPSRWMATILYRSERNGIIPQVHFFEEIEDLHDIVERGHSFYAIERITITINPEQAKLFNYEGRTIEQEERGDD